MPDSPSAPRSVAILGAGAAGLGVAFGLRQAGWAVTLIEKSRGLTGRAATRYRHGADGAERGGPEGASWVYDHGAQYLKAERDSRTGHLVTQTLPTDDLVEIGRAIWVHDGKGQIEPGDPSKNQEPQWTYTSGIKTLGTLLYEEAKRGASRLNLLLETRAHRLRQTEAGWTVETTEGDTLGPYDAVVMTPPGPQSRELVEASALETERKATLLDALEPAAYRAQFSVVLAYDHIVERPGDFYALVNPDGEHPIAWLAFESDKQGHAPDGCTLVMLQMGDAWTQAHYETNRAEVTAEAQRLAAELLGTDLSNPLWTDSQRWRYSLPNTPASPALGDAEADGLFFAGDFVMGKGRVHLALESGLYVAERLLKAYA